MFKNKTKKIIAVTLPGTLTVIMILFISTNTHGIPYFARKYDFQCGTCHVIPPKLNQFGENFRANGYRLPDIYPTKRTWPFALWITERGELEYSKDFEKTFPNRVEVISGGPIGEKFSYFVEWRMVSLETESDGDLRDRSGRFEDIFVNYGFLQSFNIKMGQFRLLNQVDDSLKLGVSTPVVIGTSIAGDTSRNPRKTSLRSFAPANRSPAISLEYHTIKSENSADGWFNIISLPFPGEFSIPLTDEARDEASFEFEFDPKGVFIESFYSWGLSSIGANLFVDDYRSTGSVLGVYNWGPFFSTVGLGYGRESGETSFRFSWENELVPIRFFSLGARLDHRSDVEKGTAFIPNINIQWPLTKWTLRLVLEQRAQADNHATLAELSVVF